MAKEIKINKAKDTEELLAQINAKYGKGSIVGASSGIKDFAVITTGSISLDMATDCGGIPRGKLIEILGMESSGKSTISLHIISEFQKAGLTCALQDHEHSFDKGYATDIGVDVDKLLISQPNSMEDGYNMAYDLITSGLIHLLIIDSHTAMVSKMRTNGDSAIGDAKIAPEARVNSDALRKIKPELDKYNCTMIGISQMRDNIGSMSGDIKIGTGGNSWKFYPDMRIKIFKILDRLNETNKTTVEIIKNKCGKPFGKCIIPIAWGEGIDKITEVIELAIEIDLIKKGGAWYTLPSLEKPIQGSESVKIFLQDNPELFKEIETQVKNHFNPQLQLETNA